MKSRCALLIALALSVLSFTAPAHAAPGTATVDGITYSYEASNATLIGNDDLSGALTIPSRVTIGGTSYSVTAIGVEAFDFGYLTSVTIPDSVTVIADRAFYSNDLTSVDLGEGVTSIGVESFAHNYLTTLVIPSSVTSIADYSMHGNPWSQLRFMGAQPTIGGQAFGTSLPRPTVRYPWRFGPTQIANAYTNFPGSQMISVAQVSLSTTGTGAAAPAPQYVDIDETSTPTRPTDPSISGGTFLGWFTTAGGTTPFDFAAPVTQDATAYARFKVTIAGLRPTIVGDPREGRTLTARPGAVSPSATTFQYQWSSNRVAIKGATRSTFKPGKAQAGTRVTVTITARTPSNLTATTVTKTSASTKLVSSASRRIQVSTRKVAKGKSVTVTATGFRARQKVTISLGGKVVYKGRADSRGIVTRSVKFAKKTKAGQQKITVTSFKSHGKKDKTISVRVRYR